MLTRLLPTYWQLATLLLMVYYFFVTVGEQVFGGLIYTTNPALEGSDFKNGQYWALNFNDFMSGMMTLFCLMVVNNWFIIADGFLRVSGTRWSCVFFVSFFVLVNLVLLNILVALILDCFTTLEEEQEPAE